jgi:CARDB
MMIRPSRVMLLAVMLFMMLGGIAPVGHAAWPQTSAAAARCAWLYGVRVWQASLRFSYRYKATSAGSTATTDAAASFTTVLTTDPGGAAGALDWHTPVGQAGQGFVTEHWQETQKGVISVVDNGSGPPEYVPALGPRTESTVAYLHTDSQGCSYTLDLGAKLSHVTIHSLGSGSTGVYPLVIGIAGLDSPHVVPSSADPAHPPTLGGSAVLRVAPYFGSTGDRFAVSHDDPIYGDPNATADVSWLLTPYPGDAPVLQLDPELFERNTFLDQVSVEDVFNADVTWNTARGGHITWQLGAAPATQSADTTDSVVPDPVDVGRQPVGSTSLSAQARSVAGRESLPATSQIQTVVIPKWAGSIDNISATKKGKTVEYQFQVSFPQPAFTAETTVPSVIPFFGGNPLGMEKGQVTASAKVDASGAGSAKGQGGITFVAMGQALAVKAALEAALILDRTGLDLPKGKFQASIGGKLSKEEPLLVAIPPLTPLVASLENASPAAVAFLKQHAKLGLTLEPEFPLTLTFHDQNGDLVFDEATLNPGLGLKAAAKIDLLSERLEAEANIGGKVAVHLHTPAPYFKGVDGAFTVSVKISLKLLGGTWSGEAEKTWPFTIVRASQATSATTPSASWQLADRSYLTAPDYARWDAALPPAVDGQDGSSDQPILHTIFPGAHPAVAVDTNSTPPHTLLLWSHDVPGTPQLSGQELAFAQNSGSGWGSGFTLLTHDTRADLNPRLVLLADGTPLAVWQRYDTTTPGDFNADPAGYLSHLQIAAGTFNPNASTPAITPQQISASGSLNDMPQVGATTDGALLVWVNNPTNQLLGDAAHPDALLFSHYTLASHSWSVPAQLLGGVSGLLDMRLATAGNHTALVYSRDTDGDLSTSADRALFYTLWQNGSWSAPVRLTSGIGDNEMPLLALDDNGAPLLVWQRGDQLLFLHGAWNAMPAPLPLPADLSRHNLDLARGANRTLALTWQEIRQHDTRIGYAIYDAAHARWSDARTLTPPIGTHTADGISASVSDVAPALISGASGAPDRLSLAYLVAAATPITTTLDGIPVVDVPQVGNQDLRVVDLPLASNLRVTPADLALTPAAASPGAPIVLHAVVRNTGLRTLSGVPVQLVARRGQAGGTETGIATQPLPLLAAGSAITLTFNTTAPTDGATQLGIHIDPAGTLAESSTADNEAFLGSSFNATALPTQYTSQSVLPQLVIRQGDGLANTAPLSMALTLDAPEGPTLDVQETVLPLARTDGVTLTSILAPARLGPGRHLLYWHILAADASAANTGPIVSAAAVLPDLFTTPSQIVGGPVVGASAPITIVVMNQGPVASNGGMVRIYDGLPGQASTHALVTLPFPPLAAGGSAAVQGVLHFGANTPAGGIVPMLYVQIDPNQLIDEIDENNNLVRVGGSLKASPGRVYLPLVRR